MAEVEAYQLPEAVVDLALELKCRNARRLAEAVCDHALAAHEVQAVERFFKAIFESDPQPLRLVPTSPLDHIFLQQLNEFISHTVYQDGHLHIRSTYQAPDCSLDMYLLITDPINTLIFWVNLAVNSLIAKSKRISLVTSVKNEGPWLLEFVAHYKSLGFSDIFIYYNNTDDGSVALLSALQRHGEIKVFHNLYEMGFSPQKKAFSHALHLLRHVHESEWIFFCDADEFLVCPRQPQSQIGEVINALEVQFNPVTFDAIAINWRWFADPNQYAWTDGLVMERFQTAYRNSMKKCLFRPECASSIFPVHYPRLIAGANAIDSTGVRVGNLSPDYLPVRDPIFIVNHYFAKSFEEFFLKKLRGRATDVSDVQDIQWESFLWGIYVAYNEAVDEKLVCRTKEELNRLLQLVDVSALNEEIKTDARLKISQAGKNIGLPAIFAGLKGGVLKEDQTGPS